MTMKTIAAFSIAILLVLTLILTAGPALAQADDAQLTPQQRANRALQQADRQLRAYQTPAARQALEPVLDEGRADMLVAIGRVFEQEKNYPEAERKLRRATELAPSDPAPWLHLGSTLTYARKEAPAKAAYTRAVELAQARVASLPEDAKAHYLLGAAQSGAGQLGSAFSSLQRARELDPGMSEAIFEQGIVRFKQQQWQQAFDLLTQVIEKDPRHAYAFYYRGYAASRINRKDATINDFTRFLELAPEAPEALRARRVIESVS